MRIRRKIQDWVKTRFLFVIRKEEDFSVITSFTITKVRITLLLILFLFMAFGFSLFLSRTALRAWFDPEYLESENINRIVALSETVDSLLVEVHQRDAYVKNIQRVITGDTPQVPELDNLNAQTLDENEKSKIDLFQSSEATRSIVEEYQSAPLDFSVSNNLSPSSFSNIYFFPPVKGMVIASFEQQKAHFGTDILAKEDEPVKAIADGTVILSSWTLESGYIMGIQHPNELISIYKHNSVILKNVGEMVKAGEIISIIGNTGELTSGPHLHFELWYRGNPMNPQQFITFD